jgi:hypothetical protein
VAFVENEWKTKKKMKSITACTCYSNVKTSGKDFMIQQQQQQQQHSLLSQAMIHL